MFLHMRVTDKNTAAAAVQIDVVTHWIHTQMGPFVHARGVTETR